MRAPLLGSWAPASRMIGRERWPQLLTVMQKRLGDLHVLPVLPKPHKAATRVLIRGRRDARAPVTLLPPLVLQDMEGQTSPAAESVLRHGAALAFAEAGG